MANCKVNRFLAFDFSEVSGLGKKYLDVVNLSATRGETATGVGAAAMVVAVA